jgi:hypothetical protein
LHNEIKAEEMKTKKTDYSALELENLEKNMENNIKESQEDNLIEEKKLEVDMKDFSNLEAQDKIEINSKLHFIVITVNLEPTRQEWRIIKYRDRL